MSILFLFLTITIILLLIMKFKFHAALSLFIGALFMGITCGIGMNETLSIVTTGFGNMMASMGFSVAFGVMLGHLMSKTGAVQVIANGVLRLFGKDRAEYGMGITGFIISIPVFFDVGFVVLTPLARELARKHKQIPYYVGGLVGGLAMAHAFVPPTPGPLSCAEIMGINLGTMITWGIIIGFPTMLISLFIYGKILDRGIWNPEKDEAPEMQTLMSADDFVSNKTPSMAMSLLPILIPIILILAGTIASANGISDNAFLNFISNKNIALFVGLLASMVLALSSGMDAKTMERELSSSVAAIGTILFITGAGGSLCEVMKASGLGEVLLGFVESTNISPILFAWLVAWLLKVAQGSSTVAMITALGIMAPMMGVLTVNPVLVTFAAISGTLGGSHVNDSGFWSVTQIAGFTTSGGFKTESLVPFIESIVSLIIIFVLSLFI